MRRLGVRGTVRASFHVYNVRAEIDALAGALGEARAEVNR
jgi:selenocysteine lyase/cysteine desulfurase